MIRRIRTFVPVLAQALVVATLLGIAMPVHAEIIVNSVNMFRDFRGPNDVGVTTGDRIQYGANVVGGSLGTSLGATYPPTNFRDAPIACSPLAVNPNFCSNSTPFNANRIAQPWNLNFSRGTERLTVAAPSIAGAGGDPVPHPTNVTISGSGTTPTISWNLPIGYVPDGFRIQILDRSQIRNNGQADIIHNDALPSNATSYTLPAKLETNQSLAIGGNYAINFQVIETRNNVPFTGNNAQILSRSNAWFAFSPLDNNAPPNVFLPQVNDNGAFQFEIGSVGPNSVTFIDPLVAIGYDYAIGSGDPNFKSVLLPFIGDDLYELLFGSTSLSLHAGDEFFLPSGRRLGI